MRQVFNQIRRYKFSGKVQVFNQKEQLARIPSVKSPIPAIAVTVTVTVTVTASENDDKDSNWASDCNISLRFARS